MAADAALDPASLPGCRWSEQGFLVLSGDLMELFRKLDALFLRWAAESGAEELLVPPLIAARDLARIDTFGSFPHLVTLPVALDPDDANLARFAQANTGERPRETVELAELSPVREVLNPAACYHVYPLLSGQNLPAARTFTLCAPCFRREARYLPLERQWSFHMREIVCVGRAQEVSSFLERARERIGRFFERARLAVQWRQATDPFFRPLSSPKRLLQVLDPVKEEMTFRDRLAVGSINLHRSYFGEAFGISAGGEEAHSGCVAFGLERWVYLVLSSFGTRREDWADLELWRE